jgi:hypothetical protein
MCKDLNFQALNRFSMPVDRGEVVGGKGREILQFEGASKKQAGVNFPGL